LPEIVPTASRASNAKLAPVPILAWAHATKL
jgi:hypothetical protein